MSNRLDKDREKRLQPKRIQSALDNLNELGLDILSVSETTIKFEFKNEVVTYFPYSGWHAGRSIKHGRGWKNLSNQLK